MKFKLKWFICILFIILLSFFVLSDDVLTGNPTGDTETGLLEGQWIFQGFNVSADKTLTQISVYVSDASPSIDLVIVLEGCLADGTPDGNILFTGSIPAASIPANPTYAWFNLSTGGISLTADTRYCLVFNGTGSSGADYYFYYKTPKPYHGGDFGYSVDLGSTWSNLDRSMIFYVYGTDPPPAEILLSNYNCTSCNPPVGDTTEPFDTDDTTPTFTFDSNANTNCTIGISDVNYTTQGSGRACAGGEGTTSHTCTIISNDSLNTFPDYVYFSCRGDSGAENSSSSSGPLQVGIYGSLIGNVTDGNSLPVQDALITVSLNNTNTTMHNTTTDANGYWNVSWTRLGVYTICAYKPSNSTLRGDCTPFVTIP